RAPPSGPPGPRLGRGPPRLWQGHPRGSPRSRTGGLMSSAPTIPPLTGTITVDAPMEQVFRTFTDGFGSWWPAEYHIGQADMATAILEPRQGGRWYEQGTDGSESEWGRVLAWEPPHRLVVTWQINGQWQYDPDPAHASEIEVRFTADGPDQTTVELEHRRLERLVGGQTLRDGITGGGGWSALLELLAKAATNQTYPQSVRRPPSATRA